MRLTWQGGLVHHAEHGNAGSHPSGHTEEGNAGGNMYGNTGGNLDGHANEQANGSISKSLFILIFVDCSLARLFLFCFRSSRVLVVEYIWSFL
jgi:hypothetical protein